MTTKPKKYRSIRTQIISQFCGLAVVLSLLFSAFNFINLYQLEDSFLNRMLDDEANYLIQHFERTGEWTNPRNQYITLYHNSDSFPDDLLTLYKKEPQRVEFPGAQDRYYHLYRLNTDPKKYLIAQVESQLLVRANRDTILLLLGIWSLIMLLVAAYLGYRLGKRSFEPLSRLSSHVANLSPEQLPKQFAAEYPNNEIGYLAQVLDDAMQRIAHFIEREQHFTRDASHELRTPISVVKNATELLIVREKDLPEKSQQLLNRINDACRQMEQTVSTLLSLAREDTDKTQTSITLLPIVEKIIIQQSPLLNNKPIEVKVNIPHDATVFISEATLHILLSNLISNAFQYTSDGEVIIQFSGTELTVSDTGGGINETIKDKAHQPLIKGPNSQGFGIGLSLVKRMCDHHGINWSLSQSSSGVVIKLQFSKAKLARMTTLTKA